MSEKVITISSAELEQIIDDKINARFAKIEKEKAEIDFVVKNAKKFDKAVEILGWEGFYIVDPNTNKRTKKLPPDKEAQIIEYLKSNPEAVI